MYRVYGDVVEEKTQGEKGPTGEGLCGPGQTPKCGESLNLYNLD